LAQPVHRRVVWPESACLAPEQRAQQRPLAEVQVRPVPRHLEPALSTAPIGPALPGPLAPRASQVPLREPLALLGVDWRASFAPARPRR